MDVAGIIETGWPYVAAAMGAVVVALAVMHGWKRFGRAPSRRRAVSIDGNPIMSHPPTLVATPHVLVLADEAHSAQVRATIEMRCVSARNAIDLVEKAKRGKPVAVLVDVDLLPQLRGVLDSLPVVGIIDAPPAESLSTTVRVLDAYPGLANVISAQLLGTPQGKVLLENLLERLSGGPEHDLLGTASVGRVAMLAQASQRERRFERMHTYFTNQQVSPRTISAIQDVAEELVMNALYSAPSEAGFFDAPVSRTEDVTLPLDRACEISYGMEAGSAFVRIRDTFGSLRRERLLDVLTRCNSTDVTLDESNGGAGLGLWRIFSAASTIAITVIPGRLTDILIRISPRQAKTVRQLLAVHLSFFPENAKAAEPILLDQDSSMVDHSITLIQA